MQPEIELTVLSREHNEFTRHDISPLGGSWLAASSTDATRQKSILPLKASGGV
jgi:hypothetical protein